MKLKDKAIVVTGASSGMGKVIVEQFVKEGAKVVAVARRVERLEALAESLKDEAGEIVIYPGDVSKLEVCEGMIDECVKQFGRLDVLVNNAGVATTTRFMDDEGLSEWNRVINTNLHGPANVIHFRPMVSTAQKMSARGRINGADLKPGPAFKDGIPRQAAV